MSLICQACLRRNPEGAVYCAWCGTAMRPCIPPVSKFPVWALLLLHFATLGLFSLVWINLYHGKFPRTRAGDPSSARAVGFCFIPLFNLYWVFFTHLRLCERLDKARESCGLAPERLKPFAVAACMPAVLSYVVFCICVRDAWHYADLVGGSSPTEWIGLAFLQSVSVWIVFGLPLYAILAAVFQASINELQDAASGRLWRCSTCGGHASLADPYCPVCLALPAEVPLAQEAEVVAPRFRFFGTGWQLLGWLALNAIGLFTVVGYAWTLKWLWQWFVNNTRLGTGVPLHFIGKASHILGYCVTLAALSLLFPAAQASVPPNKALLLIPLGLSMEAVTAWLVLSVLRKWVSNTFLQGETPARFTASYWTFLGWRIAFWLSVLAIVAWAWVLQAYLQWLCDNIATARYRLVFCGRPREILWRGVLALLMCLGIVTWPWAAVWLLRWLVENVALLPRLDGEPRSFAQSAAFRGA